MDCNQVSSTDELVLNIHLHEDLEQYEDGSWTSVEYERWPLNRQNDYLARMLDWEEAPVLPLLQCFDPPLKFVPVAELSEAEVNKQLKILVNRLYERKIVLDFTGHLSDRELYNLIIARILPCKVKKLQRVDSYQHWNCVFDLNGERNDTIWLTYYASEYEREQWQQVNGWELPPMRSLPYPRELPQEEGFWEFLQNQE